MCAFLLGMMLEFFARRVEQSVQQLRCIRPKALFLRLGLGRDVGGLLHEIALAVKGDRAVPPGIGPVGQQVAGLHIVPQLAVQHPPQLLLQLGVVDGAGDLHPAV